MRLLVLEDDDRLCSAYCRRLRTAGYAVDAVRTLVEARAALVDEAYDCLVLDRLVPDGDAVDLVAELSAGRDHVPVLMVSGAFADAVDRVRGLEAGADDYAAKPVPLDELVLRVRKLTLPAELPSVPAPDDDRS